MVVSIGNLLTEIVKIAIFQASLPFKLEVITKHVMSMITMRKSAVKYLFVYEAKN